MPKCTGDDMIGKQCPNEAIWRNQKLLLDAFTWEKRNDRKWEPINENI